MDPRLAAELAQLVEVFRAQLRQDADALEAMLAPQPADWARPGSDSTADEHAPPAQSDTPTSATDMHGALVARLHRIAGGAATYQLTAIAEQARRLEEALRAGRVADLRGELRSFAAQLRAAADAPDSHWPFD